MEKLVVLFALLLGLGAGACSSPPLPAGDPGRPDLILVSIDTLRADHLYCYGYERPTSPFLDSLARSGVLFLQARSPSPWTLPAHASMLSGQLPHQHLAVEDDCALGADLPLVSGALSSVGYRSAAFVSTLFVSSRYGFQRGFQTFQDFGILDPETNLEKTVSAEKIVDSAISWLENLAPGEPFFLFLHFYDVHYSYDPPAPYDTIFDRAPRKGDVRYKNYFYHKKHPLDPQQLGHQVAQYDESIRYVDQQLSRLFHSLEESARTATWIVTADHGEELGERGSWGHAHTLFQEQLHVPLLITGPSVISPNQVETAVGLQDIAPTLAALGGTRLPTAQGIDLSPALAGASLPQRAFVADTSRFSSNRLSIYQDGWRLDLDLKTDTRALYDINLDPGELRNRFGDQPARAAAMESLLLSRLGEPWEAMQPVVLRSRHWFLESGQLWKGRLSVKPGDRFQLLPYDAGLGINPHKDTWRAVGNRSPGPGAAIRYRGVSTGEELELRESERQLLEALGYLQ